MPDKDFNTVVNRIVNKKRKSKIDIGWREWISLIEYNNFYLKAKIDTGATMSALHATHIKEYDNEGCKYVRFRLYQSDAYKMIKKPIVGYKTIKNSFGKKQLRPLIKMSIKIGDNVFIGARSEVAEGVIVREGSVLSMGVFISASTKIVDRDTGKIHMGEVPPYSVVVPGALPGKNGEPSLACVVIVKQVDSKTRSKTSINDLLRD